jgi:DNA-binding GntR family transcriptional regulator
MQTQLAARDNLSDALIALIRERIVDGRLADGSRINEVHLARELGVSRTPLREALAGLEREGAIEGIPRKGWFVRPLTLAEFEQIYAIRPLLDPEALRLAGLPDAPTLARLRALNAKIERARKPEEILALDDEWHMALIGTCTNRVLLDLIRAFTLRTRRYEIALMRERRSALLAVSNHRAVMAALGRGDLEAAVKALRHNLQTGREPVTAWLRNRKPAGDRR